MIASLESLKGVITPLVTPFKAGAVDYDAYARLVQVQIDSGSHGILINGTTSEPSSLTVDERNKLVSLGLEIAKNKVHVVAATGSQSLAETRALTDHAITAGADSLLIVTPYYSRPPQRGIIEYYATLAEGHSTPWMIYHIPGRAAVSVTLDTVKTLKDRCPNFVGMKHAVGDLGFVSECIAAFGEDFRIFVGLEEWSFPMMAVGACGLMNAAGNIQPKPLVKLVEAVWRGDLTEARRLHYALKDINDAIFYDINPIPMKYMMKKIGLLPDNEHRLPLLPATPDLEKRLDGVLRDCGLLAQ